MIFSVIGDCEGQFAALLPRTSHGVGQYDLERASTWAMIGSSTSKPEPEPGPGTQQQPAAPLQPPPQQVTSKEPEVDYKKVQRVVHRIIALVCLSPAVGGIPG